MTVLTRTLTAAFLFLGSLAWISTARSADKPSVSFELRRAESKPAEGLTEATVEGTKNKVYLHKKAELTKEDIAQARVTDLGDHPAVEITFTEQGQKKFARLTEDHLGKPLAIMVAGKVLAAPIVRAKVSGGKALLSGNYSKETAEGIVKTIKEK